MSLSAISTNFAVPVNFTQSMQAKNKKIEQEFQQLGKDLQAGNTTAAQADYATLKQMVPALNSTSSQSYDPRVRAFSQLGQDLQSGNTAGAQADYVKLHQVFQHQGHVPHHVPTPAQAYSTLQQEVPQSATPVSVSV